MTVFQHVPQTKGKLTFKPISPHWTQMLRFYELNMNNQKQYLEAIIPSALRQHTLIRLSNLLRLPLGFAKGKKSWRCGWASASRFLWSFSRYVRGLIKSRLFCLHFLDLSASFGAHTGKKIILRKFALEQICETSRSFFRSCPVLGVGLGGCRGIGGERWWSNFVERFH